MSGVTWERARPAVDVVACRSKGGRFFVRRVWPRAGTTLYEVYRSCTYSESGWAFLDTNREWYGSGRRKPLQFRKLAAAKAAVAGEEDYPS